MYTINDNNMCTDNAALACFIVKAHVKKKKVNFHFYKIFIFLSFPC